jgi:SAM-dependent methyltransferase
LLGDYRAAFGAHWSFNFRSDPRRLAFVLSRYKFAAKMACKNASVLELGCSDGIGAPILAEQAHSYLGVDLDLPAVVAAQNNLSEPKFRFLHDDFMGRQYGAFGAVISLDVVEHIRPEFADQYFETVMHHVAEDGVCVIGTPNSTASAHASEASRLGHVNLYTQERLIAALRVHFHQVFPFGMNDELVHTGFAPMCHYLIAVACHKKREHAPLY